MPTLPKAVLCDIDGTLAHMNGRSPFEWHRVAEDEIDETINWLLLRIGADATTKIVFFSGRDEVCRPETLEWLSRHGWPHPVLIMRKQGDNRKDSIVKRELYERHINGAYDVLFVLDDRNQVVNMWRNELGLKCLQVAEGDF